MTATPRTPRQRRLDTLRRFEQDVDAWVATADPATGAPYLVPLSFLWDGETFLFATPVASQTGRNLESTGDVRLGVGGTRDVIVVHGTATTLPTGNLPNEVADAFAVKTGFDPRELTTDYRYFRVRPRRIQAWREADELVGRDLMRDGRWLVS
jgi:pyridoxamine 5'-phosphate oxidase-like protein